jgi:hypothetical protein
MTYDRDPVVEEVRKVREEIMKEFDYDLREFGQFLIDREKRRRPVRKPGKIQHRRTVKLNGVGHGR